VVLGFRGREVQNFSLVLAGTGVILEQNAKMSAWEKTLIIGFFLFLAHTIPITLFSHRGEEVSGNGPDPQQAAVE
jgi:hypothetical protein